MKIKIIALFGKAGAGKDTIQKWMVKNIPNTHKIISCTTRPKRDKERDGVDYYFLSPDEFADKVLDYDMIEASCFNGWYYGTPISSLDRDKINIGVFNIEGIDCLIEEDGVETFDILPILIDTNDVNRLKRQLNRERDPDCGEICRRFLTDEKDFADIPFDYIKFDNNRDLKYMDGFYIDNLPEVKEFIGQD